ncbi:MAG: BamA/TamA family outer membrane protein [Bacteroidota bacterium]|nr:BamA/TamA family outer membrane protein [Bacteroidota bacterium]
MNNPVKYLLLLMIGLLASCSLTKYVPEDRLLLDKVELKIDRKEIKPEALKNYIKQEPNYRVFGLFRTSLYIYDFSGKDSTKWFNRFFRKSGNPPVLLDDELSERTRDDLEKALVNQGYMNAKVETHVVRKKKRAIVTYLAKAGEPYRLRKLTYYIADSRIDSLVKSDSANTLLKKNVLFDRSLLEQERQRVVSLLRNKGYFGVDKDLVSYVADSSLNTNQVDLEFQLFPAERKVSASQSLKEQSVYKIKNVYIQTESEQSRLGSTATTLAVDTLLYNKYHIISGKKQWIRPKVLTSSCLLRPGRTYNERLVELTYSSFSRLKVIKYINIRFEPVYEGDSCFLNCFLLITPGKPQSVSTEVEGTNSAGDLGAAVSVTYQHRNIFKGSETFSAKVRGAYERLSGTSINANFTELSTDMGLSFPKFIFPLLKTEVKRRVRAVSELTGSYNFQQRPEYTRIIAGGGWRYKWSVGRNGIRHSLDVLDVNYVKLPWIASDFFDNFPVDNPLLHYSYENHLIVRTGYTFNKTNQTDGTNKNNLYSFRFNVESAGNSLTLLSKLFNATKKENGYQFLGVNYAQYVKTELDYARTKIFDERNSLAWHVGFGVACPYGNSEILPFEKRYFGGGANSIRGWAVRSLGPGTYRQVGTSADFVNQSGDIKLEMSTEYRAKLFGPIETALFVDAGNIWTIRDYKGQEGGVFKFDSFYKQIALAYGTGIRFNFNYFIVRVDIGVKAFDPSRDGYEKWRIRYSPLKNMAWHFAVGYPF